MASMYGIVIAVFFIVFVHTVLAQLEEVNTVRNCIESENIFLLVENTALKKLHMLSLKIVTLFLCLFIVCSNCEITSFLKGSER